LDDFHDHCCLAPGRSALDLFVHRHTHRVTPRKVTPEQEFTGSLHEAAIRDDPRTVQIAKRWSAARAAVQAALDLENQQTEDLLGGAFGQPDDRRPAWLNYWALN
jgi:hypothetical protein